MRDRYDFSDSEPNPYAERMKRQVTAGDHKQALSPGFRLGAYRVARVLGVGGFGVTYLCEHTGLAVQVAVKEYLPNEIAVPDGTEVHPKSSGDREGFEWGLSRFLDEARTLARFEHPNVARAGLLRGQQHRLHRDGWRAARLLLRRRGALTEGQLKAGASAGGGRSAAGSRGGLSAPGHQTGQHLRAPLVNWLMMSVVSQLPTPPFGGRGSAKGCESEPVDLV